MLIDRDMARDTADESTDTPRDTADTPTEGEATAKVVDAKDETIRVLKDQLEAEREANRENRRIIAGLVQRVPELEAPPEEREEPETASPIMEGVETPIAQEKRFSSWLRRWFGGPGEL